MSVATSKLDEYLASLPPEEREIAKRHLTPNVVKLVEPIFELPEKDQDAAFREMERILEWQRIVARES